ncbi:murein hydrolase activator EnvC family protein [Variovorax arabinosiphilus]|jgi:lipoprotein NlpD|uniref:murein hydrolase activator EnvC family protein n=1 Tax=Variovorax arabinosiphilus TaxID=3053498 RepID=UPI0025786B5C|nr:MULTISPECIES: M23 family metallopeptidase [unclassified Variovorax]MDM0121417.1 M23 family metallopeptidase [Variovorax sp. J2L1-78]MDM0130478.1 M23 family metallopeptidase [Variovorax sp. J2L1-63]MDM0234180.1 M23 family metallopeptidase [Variovorax sp. J2R1-6]
MGSNMHLFPLPSVMRRSTLVAVAAAALAACGTTTPLPPMAPLPTYPVPAAPPPAPLPAPTPPGLRDAPGATFGAPAAGPVIGRFDGNANKGIDIGGRMGDPIRASRAGQVVLVSSALPAYGTMVILKHDNDFITAYAHISRPLVAEGDQVARGQPIAEMGQSGTDRVKLRFEIRKAGVAVDPEPYLSGRMQ